MTCVVNVWVQHAASSDTPRGFSSAFVAAGWPYINTTLQTQIQSVGPDEIMFWLAFGHPASGDFDLASYQACQDTAGLELIADQSAFVTAITTLFQQTGVRKIWFYEGYLGGHAATWAGLTTAQKQAKIAANLAPYLAVQSALVALGYSDPVGMLFDTLNWPAEGFAADNWTLVIPYAEANFSNVGGEPWPSESNPRLSDSSWMSVMDERDQESQEDGVGAADYPWAGPVCPYVIGVTSESHEVRALRALARFDMVAVEPHSGLTAAALKESCEAGESGGGGNSVGGTLPTTPGEREVEDAVQKFDALESAPEAPPIWFDEPVDSPNVPEEVRAIARRAALATGDTFTITYSNAAWEITSDGTGPMVQEYGSDIQAPRPWVFDAIHGGDVA